MTRENVRMVELAYEALNERDVEAFMKNAHPDVVQDWSRALSPQRGIYRGREEVVEFLRSWWEAFDESAIVVDELIEAGDHVVAVFHGHQRGRASGIEIEGRVAVLVWTFRDGKVVEATLYQNREDALEAVRSDA